MSQRDPATMLVSCAVCCRLHEPLRPLDLNPVCTHCGLDEAAGDSSLSFEDEERES